MVVCHRLSSLMSQWRHRRLHPSPIAFDLPHHHPCPSSSMEEGCYAAAGETHAMSLFEFVFGLQAVVLGLALTQIVVSLNRLVLAHRRVVWAAQPILTALYIGSAVILEWLSSWFNRPDASTTVGEIILGVARSLILVAAASSVLPEEVPEDRTLDLRERHDRIRPYLFFLLIVSITVSAIAPRLAQLATGEAEGFNGWGALITVAALGVCATVKQRWVNIAILTLLVLALIGGEAGYTLPAVEA